MLVNGSFVLTQCYSTIAIATYSIVQYKSLSHLLLLGFFENQNLECSNSRFYKDYLKLDEKLK